MIDAAANQFMSVPYVDLGELNDRHRGELLSAVDRVISSGMYILGEEVETFEAAFARYCGTRFAVGVANGTDALVLAMKALGIGPGDEVITAPNSFLASASSIALTGARPVFADVRDDLNIDPEAVEAAITPSTRAIMPVHLAGRPADLRALNAVAERHGLFVIEDAAQAIGARYDGAAVGSLGTVGCFSLHPLKNLHACGDGGIITTDDAEVHEFLLKARNHGLRNREEAEFWSQNSRLDSLHAAMLGVKLRYLDEETEERRRNAAFYVERLGGLVTVPRDRPEEQSVYQTFMIRADRRDELQAYLAGRGVDSKIHYPIPIHLQPAAADLGYGPGDFPVTERLATEILSLPAHPQLSMAQLEHTAGAVRRFYSE